MLDTFMLELIVNSRISKAKYSNIRNRETFKIVIDSNIKHSVMLDITRLE